MSSESSSAPSVEPLTAGNFNQWHRRISDWMRMKGWYGIMDGTKRKRDALVLATGITADMVAARDKERSDWDKTNMRIAGALAYTLSDEEHTALTDNIGNGVALYAAIRARHVQVKATKRFNAVLGFLGLTRNEGETLTTFGNRVVDAMRKMKALRPVDNNAATPATHAMTIAEFDNELVCMMILSVLSKDTSCGMLVTSLLHGNDAKLTDPGQLLAELLAEDGNRSSAPALYGLKHDPVLGLRAISAPDSKLTEAAAAASPATSPDKGKSRGSGNKQQNSQGNSTERPKCEHCKRPHKTEECFQKRLKDLEMLCTSQQAKIAKYQRAGHAEARALSPSIIDGANDAWIADTGALVHMTPNRAWFTSYRTLRTPVRLADGNIIEAAGVGSVHIMLRLKGANVPMIEFTHVLHVPRLSCNLLSILSLVRKDGFVVTARGDQILFELGGVTRLTASINERNTAYLNATTVASTLPLGLAARATLPLDMTLWHRRTMHHHHGGIRRAIREKSVTGITLDRTEPTDPICEPCIAGKMKSDGFCPTGTVTHDVLELVHGDLAEMQTESIGRKKWFALFTDDASGFRAAYPLHKKSDTYDAFVNFVRFAERHTGRKIKWFQQDAGGEFVGGKWDQLFNDTGIR